MTGTLTHGMPCDDRHCVSDVVESVALAMGRRQRAHRLRTGASSATPDRNRRKAFL
jgi:hypothetical protein